MEDGYLRLEKLTVALDSPWSVMFLKVTKCTAFNQFLANGTLKGLQKISLFSEMNLRKMYKREMYYRIIVPTSLPICCRDLH